MVAQIEAGLAAHGLHPGSVDGVFAAETGHAIVAYQHYHGLLVDGAATPELAAHLAETAPSGLAHATLLAIAAQIESTWSVPTTAKGIYHMVVPVRLSLGPTDVIEAAAADPSLIASDRPMERRLAYSAEDAARAVGRLSEQALADIEGARDITVNLRPPIGPTHRKYARKLAQRIAFYADIPEYPDRDDSVVVRLFIDGSAQSISTQSLHGSDNDSVQAAFRFIDSMPRIPPVPVEGTPKIFVVDVTFFQRDPFALDGWVAYPDWPIAPTDTQDSRINVD